MVTCLDFGCFKGLSRKRGLGRVGFSDPAGLDSLVVLLPGLGNVGHEACELIADIGFLIQKQKNRLFPHA